MAEIDVKPVADLVAAIGPTDEHRKSFAKTFFGTVIGQTIVFVGMLLTYAAAIGLLNRYFRDDLHTLLQDVGPFWFVVLLGSPFACILLFSMTPTMLRALRERRLKAAVFRGSPEYRPGYFRLYPYGASDRASYRRLDDAAEAVLGWVKSAQPPVLYLSGTSGVGKSSLLAADVLPSLRDEDWIVVETRSFADPAGRLRDTLLTTPDLYSRKPSPETDISELLKRAADARIRKNAPPLLIVIDQFEEFLILNEEEKRKPFAALLNQLILEKIAGLKVLLVFRSDYNSLIFKLQLPPLDANSNWKEVPPYDRGEATNFLQGGGRELPAEGIDALLRGLDRIEEARGIYRPITLNMVGLVLERMGQRLEGDPSRLIQSYLTAAMTGGESRDFTKQLLASMITEVGTKVPRSVADLAAITGLAEWRVKASLAELSQRGLVRRLEGPSSVWEVSHDFLARSIGQLIGRLKPSPLQRARPLIAPIVLFGWIALAFLSLLYLPLARERSVQNALLAMDATFGRSRDGGRSATLPYSLSQEDLSQAAQLLSQISNLTSLNLSSNPGITSVEPLQGLTNLTSLNLSSNPGITSVEPLQGLTNLTYLDLRESGVTDVGLVTRPSLTIIGP